MRSMFNAFNKMISMRLIKLVEIVSHWTCLQGPSKSCRHRHNENLERIIAHACDLNRIQVNYFSKFSSNFCK